MRGKHKTNRQKKPENAGKTRKNAEKKGPFHAEREERKREKKRATVHISVVLSLISKIRIGPPKGEALIRRTGPTQSVNERGGNMNTDGHELSRRGTRGREIKGSFPLVVQNFALRKGNTVPKTCQITFLMRFAGETLFKGWQIVIANVKRKGRRMEGIVGLIILPGPELRGGKRKAADDIEKKKGKRHALLERRETSFFIVPARINQSGLISWGSDAGGEKKEA